MSKIVFKILLLFASVVLVMPVMAQIKKPTPTPTPEKKKIEYVLPYPGILPDHPLYVLKKVRDYILDKLIVDPVRKTEFYVLQADKRLNMGLFLAGRGKLILAEQTISKGEKYLDKAIGGFVALRREGKPVPGHVTDRLEKAMAKHIEVLEEMIGRAEGDYKTGLAGSLELVKRLQENFTKAK
ncbi:MAG: DUF5667 domain-containing protein [Patescibacteria group bacterium]